MNLTKTKSYDHQLKIIEDSKDREFAGYFMEQGTGKTHVTIAVATHLFLLEKINVLLVFAPNGVHDNWAINEIPTHCILVEGLNMTTTVWRASDGMKKRNRFEEVLENIRPGHLTVIMANIEALRTTAFLALLQKHVLKASIFDNPNPEAPRIMMVVDESTTIKNPKADVTKAAIKVSAHCKYRRILTGTPVSQGPLDLFAQCRFLGKEVLPYNSYTAFKYDYAIEQPVDLGPGRPRFMKIIGYRNADKLAAMIKPFTWRVLKKDCLDLPEKIYQTRYVELTPEQKRLYKQLVSESLAVLPDGTVTSLHAITTMLRCQQIVLGYVTDDNKTMRQIPSNRISVLGDLLAEIPSGEKVIIFCRFKEDIRRIIESFEPADQGTFVEYHGEISESACSAGIDSFQKDPRCTRFLATSAAARGITLTAATHVIYYSQGFSLEIRLQSEDRPHRIGQTRAVTYTNVVARGTVDEKAIRALMMKNDIANLILTRDVVAAMLTFDE